MKFLKENWAWIVVPILVFAAVVIVIVMLGSDPLDQYGYNLR
ncbi:MAG: hypothetical protein R3F49_01870 [Planctomycetota bacterium]